MRTTADAVIGTAIVDTVAEAPVEITNETPTVAGTETKEVTVSGTGITAVASVMTLLKASASRRANDAGMTLEKRRRRWTSTKIPQLPIKAHLFRLARPSVRNVNAAHHLVARVENVVRNIAPLAMMNVTGIGIESMTGGPVHAALQIMTTADDHTIGISLPGVSPPVIGTSGYPRVPNAG